MGEEMTFGQKLQTLQKEKGISQEKLADRLGVSRQAVSKWELDATLPETENIIKIRNLFNVSFDYLMDENINERNSITDICADAVAKGIYDTKSRTGKEYNKVLYIFLMAVVLISGFMALRLMIPFIPVLVLFVQYGFDTSLMPTALAYAVKFYTPAIRILMAVCIVSLTIALKIKNR